MLARLRFKIIAYAVLLVAAVSLLWWWGSFSAAWGRDYERLGDLRQLQSELNYYFSRFNTYQIEGCQSGWTVSDCSGAGDRVARLGGIVDPINSGNYRYAFQSLTDDDFVVDLALEVGVGGLPAGPYRLTRAGITPLVVQ